MRSRRGWHDHVGVKRACLASVIALAMLACTPIRPLDEPGDGGQGGDAGRDGGTAREDAGCSGPELCNGADDDCDPSTPDGSDDPMVGVSCDGPDDDLCAEGTWSCTGGALVCSDETGSTPETCDGEVDEDCDGEVDEGDAVGATTWFPDADGDGFGDDAGALSACASPTEGTWVDRGGDCDDADDGVHPGATERCNGRDDDCDGSVDDGDPCAGGCRTREHAGHVYQVCTNSRAFVNARSFCMSNGYDLVIVDDAAENAFLAAEARATGVSGGALSDGWWLGLVVAEDMSVTWVDGSSLTYDGWASGQPNDFPSCGRMWVMSETWADQLCGRSFPFFCELAP